ncbi:MAG: acetyl-CoA carboxylase biotin carboxyl carrier protein subunit [Propionibacteriaceae bacterium]|jgi:methylmalonyl-CoA carboxyltransferase small subunit|nr:acetyl-CoA carboxylase biotin carboxyl carrier protein subunit [Propionibacteriaceae bacterium]
MKLKVTVDQVPYDVDVEVVKDAAPLGAVVIGGGGPTQAPAPSGGGAAAAAGNAVPAPLAGTVLRHSVEVGAKVNAGDVLLVLEAMKMETDVTSPRAGTVKAFLADPGTAVAVGQGLVEVE